MALGSRTRPLKISKVSFFTLDPSLVHNYSLLVQQEAKVEGSCEMREVEETEANEGVVDIDSSDTCHMTYM